VLPRPYRGAGDQRIDALTYRFRDGACRAMVPSPRETAKLLGSSHATPHNASLRIIHLLRCYAKGGGRCGPNEGHDYLSVKLDDPSFNTPIYANLVHDEGAETCSLIWSRPNRRQGD
jgi:Protein of unknown function (DUF736)